MSLPLRNVNQIEWGNKDFRIQDQTLNMALENMIRFSELMNRLTAFFSENRHGSPAENKSADRQEKSMTEHSPNGTSADTRQPYRTDLRGKKGFDSAETEKMARKIQRGTEIAERVLRETEIIRKTLNRIQNNSDSDNQFYE